MENFANPEFIKTLSMGEKFSYSLTVTLLGMGITFLILVLLMFSIKLLSKVALKASEKTKEKGVVLEQDDLELVAAISAAITEYSGKDVVVCSYKEVDSFK